MSKKLFFRPNITGQKRGRPKVESVQHALETIDLYLEENSEECQFSLNELLAQIEGEHIPDVRIIKQHLIDKYKEDIVIVSKHGRPPIVCFKNIGHKILYDKWYDDQKKDAKEERLRVVKAAAEIFLEDIRSQVYETNQYPPSDDFLANVESVIPESVLYFFETVILKHKRRGVSGWKRKCVGFSHALISAVRPSSFISSLLTSVGTYLYRKFGSRSLVNLCSSLGFCCSYEDAMKLESSAIMQGTSSPPIEMVQKWLKVEKKPTDWGWKLDELGLLPVTTEMEPAPQTLLQLISCKCKKGCAASCSCRKAGLKCSALCNYCRGKSCTNVPSTLDDSSLSEDDDIEMASTSTVT